jgi:hypothetical protein
LKLIFKPVEREKVLRMDLRKKSCLASPSATIRVSSAYYITGKSSEPTFGIGSLSMPMDFPLLIKD